MLYAQLGSSGLKVSRIALGMMSYGSQTERRWHLSQDEAEPIARRAVEAGVTFFDTADTYSDGMTEEIMEALNDVVRAGKARYIGASSMYAGQFAKAQHTAQAAGWTRFTSMQNHYNLVYREEEREMIPLCLDQGVGCIPWSPLARGLLAGNRERGGEQRTVRANSDPLADSMYVDDDFDVVDAVRTVAGERGLPPAQIALAWLLGKPAVTAPIVGATKLRHLDDAIAAVDLPLTEDEYRLLKDALEQVELADRLGIDYLREVEHHSL